MGDPTPTPEQLVQRARELRPMLVQRAAETEANTFYAQDVHEEFLRAGFYRMLVPRRFGGYELSPEDFFRVVIEVAQGDMGTAWCMALASTHALNVAAMFSEQAQVELFGDGDFRCPAVAAPAGQAVRADGGWEVTGRWAYGSGSPYATHFMGATFAAPSQDGGRPGPMLLFIAPRDRWERLDDWGATLGLKGSGSHSVRMESAFLPDRYVLENRWLVDTDPAVNPGYAIHGNPIYAQRTLAVFQATLGALAIGAVRGAIDEYEQQIRTRRTQRPPIVPRYLDPDYQAWLGRAIARTAAAEAALLGMLRRHLELCRRSVEGGVPYSREDDLRLNVVARDALTLAWTALQDDLYRTGGTQASAAGQRLERIFRDVAQDWSHFGNTLRDWTARELGHERLGLVRGPALRPDTVHTGTAP
ncbi:MAG TPA: acyl-CoA dehydrogenase family protein [Solirubrobacteraceae bacterium]|nr:acyl-CoA dehydrogenase family protein [Solirubrobacteraceae bacterium]